MKNRARFLLGELVVLVFLIMLSAVILNEPENVPETNAPATSSAPDEKEPGSPETDVSNDTSSSVENTNKPDLTDWKLILASEDYPLEAEFIDSVVTKNLSNGLAVDERIYDSLMEMLDDAEALGYSLIICSAYRSYSKQASLFDNRIQRYQDDGLDDESAYEEAKKSVAVPGSSEHHTGLAVDIVSERYQNLDDGMFELEEIQWLYNNCYKYGFIVRYPEGKSDITGIIHEPWHYRYVGVEAATEIMEREITLEEYLGVVS